MHRLRYLRIIKQLVPSHIVNATFKPVSTSPLDRRITNRILHHSNEVNHLSELIHGENLNIRRAQFHRIEVARLKFLAILSYKDVYVHVAHKGQPPGYCADRIDENRDFEFHITIAIPLTIKSIKLKYKRIITF